MKSGKKKEAPPQNVAPASFWSPFRGRVFRLLWAATVVANIGGWMYNAAAGWLMTSLDSDPLMVSLVQAAASFPMFLFALPAGALADIIDKRRFILALEVLVTLVSVVFAVLVSTNLVTAWTLLLFMFVSSTLSALEAPAWQSIVPQLVPKEDLSAAVAANSVGVNISRAVGPALAGVIIAGFGIAAPFWLDAFSNVGVIAVFLWWRTSHGHLRTLPAERFKSAIRTGIRYSLNNRRLRATLLRAVGFFLFASAYWALLPLVARNQIAGGPELYGGLLAAIGCGAVGCAFILPRLKAKIGTNGLVTLGEVGTAITLVLLGFAREPIMAVCASLIAGMSWIVVVANLNVSAQVALPDWVRGRGLAMYVMVFFGTMTVGQCAVGRTGRPDGTAPHAFHRSRRRASGDTADATLEIADRRRHRSHRRPCTGQNPSSRNAVENDAGPVMVTVEYRIDPDQPRSFSYSARSALARAQTRWRLCVGRIPGHRRRGPILGNLLARFMAGAPPSAQARDKCRSRAAGTRAAFPQGRDDSHASYCRRKRK